MISLDLPPVQVDGPEISVSEEESATNSIEGEGEEEVRCIKKVMQVGSLSS